MKFSEEYLKLKSKIKDLQFKLDRYIDKYGYPEEVKEINIQIIKCSISLEKMFNEYRKEINNYHSGTQTVMSRAY